MIHYFKDVLVLLTLFDVALFDVTHFDVALFNVVLFTVSLFVVELYWCATVRISSSNSSHSIAW